MEIEPTEDIETTDHLLSTTRTVRRRLDLDRPVEQEVIMDCLRLAIQAPTGSNRQGWHWLVVRDPAVKARLGELYRAGGSEYMRRQQETASHQPDPARTRLAASAQHLLEVMDRVPVLVVPCLEGRPPAGNAAGFFGSILPATWSFMLALRSRGLGSAWTTFHLAYEEEAARILGIPGGVTQAALIPVAYTVGGDFGPARRRPVEAVTYLDRWGNAVG